MQRLTVAHAADFHLTSKNDGAYVGVGDGIWQALADMFRHLKNEDVRLLLLAGDIFDASNPEDQVVRRFKQFVAQASDLEICLCPGNHDPWTIYSPWVRTVWPDNFHILTPKEPLIVLPQLGVTIFGKAFISQSSLAEIELPDIAHLDTPFNIWLQHGDVVKTGQTSVYQPIPERQLLYSDFGYIALGHVHRQNLSGSVVPDASYRYAGSLCGRGFDECGFKGFWLGHLDCDGVGKIRPQMRLVPLIGPHFDQFELELDFGVDDLEVVKQLRWGILQKLADLMMPNEQPLYLRILLKGVVLEDIAPLIHPLSEAVRDLATYVELIDQTNLAIDFAGYASEQTVLGVYCQNIAERSELNSLETEAAKLGFAALVGEDFS